MSNSYCEGIMPLLVAHTRAELGELERARLDTHLASCSRCADRHQELVSAMAALGGWQPHLTAEHAARLSQRLQPYADALRGRARALGLGLATACALLVGGLAVWAMVARAPHAPRQAPLPLIALAPASAPATPEAVERLARTAPSAFVRLVSSEDWDGEVTSAAGKVAVKLTRGFVAATLDGGQGRRLEVTTPHARVLVVGTRFFVEVSPDGAVTTVGVVEGRVRVLAAGRATAVSAGEEASFELAGQRATAMASTRASRHVHDTFLLESRSDPIATHARATSRARVRGDEVAAPTGVRETASTATVERPTHDAPDPLALLARAESAAASGEQRAALTVYLQIAEDPRPAFAAYRDLALLEAARLQGFHFGELTAARAIFERLRVRAHGEVQRQAALAECELDRPWRPCAAATCLRTLERGADAQLAAEARTLLDRWGMTHMTCEEAP